MKKNKPVAGIFGARTKLKSHVAAFALLGGSAFLVAGCAIPVPLQIASWALDGISYLATEKSVSDHGLSIVAQKDCAVWRGVTEGELCRKWDEQPTTLIAEADLDGKKAAGAAAGKQPELPPMRRAFTAATSDIPPLAVELDDGLPSVESLANFETAAGPEETSAMPPVSVTRPMEAMLAPTVMEMPARRPVAQPVLASLKTTAVPSVLAVVPAVDVSPRIVQAAKRAAYRGDEPQAGIYFVIGSFRNYGNARDYAGRHEALIPEVLASKLNGAPVYRVVVGPVRDGGERATHRRLNRAGVADTWAIRVTPGDWLVAHAVLNRKGFGTSELAGISR